MSTNAPEYVALEKVYVDGVLIAAGDTFRSDKPPGEAWQATCKDGAKAKDKVTLARQSAARAREHALRHPEAHIGGPGPGNSALTHEQAAAIEAAPELGLSGTEASTLPSAEPKTVDKK